MNYDASEIGVPYVRVHRIEILYPDKGQPPSVALEQSLAVKMADGSVRKLEDMPTLTTSLDMAANASSPLVHPDTGLPIGPTTNLQTVMLQILAVVRSIQIVQQG